MLKQSSLAGTENRKSAEGDNGFPFPAFYADILTSGDSLCADPGNYDGDSPECGRMLSYLSELLDGELDQETQNRVDMHVENCSHCAAALDAMLATDSLIQREWRDDAPLPSPSEIRFAIDSIMDALPPVPDATPDFSSKRVHARARWIRFATGIAGAMALLMGLLWSSYRFGYEQGRLSILPGSAPSLPIAPAANPAPRRPETSRLSPALLLPSPLRQMPALSAFSAPGLLSYAAHAS